MATALGRATQRSMKSELEGGESELEIGFAEAEPPAADLYISGGWGAPGTAKTEE